MAYDADLPNIVYLIDFYNDQTNRKIIKYIGRNLLTSNVIRSKQCTLKLLKQEQSKLLDKRLEAFMKKDENYNPSSLFESSKDGSSNFNNEANESLLYDEIESMKPGSLLSMDGSMEDQGEEYDDHGEATEKKETERINTHSSKRKAKQVSIYEEVDYLSSAHPSVDAENLVALDPKYELKVTSELNKSISKRLDEKQTNYVSPFNPKRKDFSYKGYKIGFNIEYLETDGIPSKFTDIVNQKRPLSRIEQNITESVFQRPISILNESALLRTPIETPIIRSKSRVNETPNRTKSVLNESPILRTKSSVLGEVSLAKSSLNESPTFRPKSTFNEVHVKRKSSLNDFDSSVRESRISSSRILPSIINSQNTNLSALNREIYTPHTFKTSSPTKPLRRSLTIRQKSNKNTLNSNFLTYQNIDKSQNFKDSYIKSLRKSGLSNEYCVPTIRSSQLKGLISSK